MVSREVDDMTPEPGPAPAEADGRSRSRGFGAALGTSRDDVSYSVRSRRIRPWIVLPLIALLAGVLAGVAGLLLIGHL